MINYDECIKFHRNMENSRKATSTTIRVDRDQVLQIVVTDLLQKYKSIIRNTHEDCVGDKQEAFRIVLLCYLTPDELEKFYANPELIYQD